MRARDLTASDAVEPPGQVIYQGTPLPFPEECSDRSVAAVILARRGDYSKLSLMEALLEREVGASRVLLQEAIEILESSSRRRRVWARIRRAVRRRRASEEDSVG